MKKKIVGMLSLLLGLLLSVSLAACKDKAQGDPNGTSGTTTGQTDFPDQHQAKSEWKSDAAKHWHECATEGHTDKLNEANHTWDAGKVTTAPTETAEGVKTYTCTVCKHTKTETMEKLPHTHTFDTANWEKDATHHWHKATCAHTGEKDSYGAHSFGSWEVKTPAGYGVAGEEKAVCTVCGYETTRPIDALQAKDNTIAVGTIDFTYNAKSQPIDSLVTAGSKAGMVIKYVGVDGTDYAESIAAPTNAGTYQYTITIPATAEWKAAEISGKYTIEKYELTLLYEKQTIEYDGKAEKDGTKRVWFRFNTLEDNTSVNIAVIMDSANVGAKVSDIVLPGLLKTNNYTVDKDKVQIEIVPKVLSGLNFAVAKSQLIGTSGTQVITLTVPNTDGKVSVNISFDIATLTHEGTLTLITGTPGQGEAQIEFSTEEGDEYKNYAFASSSIGTLTLTTIVIGG